MGDVLMIGMAEVGKFYFGEDYDVNGVSGVATENYAKFTRKWLLSYQFLNQDPISYDNGYDSDRDLLYYDEFMVDNDLDEYEEENIVRSGANVHLEEASAVTEATVMMDLTEADVRAMTNNKLKEELRKRGKEVIEKKYVLDGILLDSIRMNVPVSSGFSQSE